MNMISARTRCLIPWSFQGSVNYHEQQVKCVASSVNVKNKKVIVVCGLRSSFKKRPPTKKVLSKEAIQVIQSLKLAKSCSDKLEQVVNTKLTRLLMHDVLDVLADLQRQNQLHLSLKVFDFIREEPGYDTLLPLYSDMILLLGRNKMVDKAEELFSHVMSKGLKPETRMYTEMIGAYIKVDMTEKAMEMYTSMKASGCSPDKLTFMILIRHLEKIGKGELAATLKEECVEYVEFPEKFIQQVEQNHAKKRSPMII